MRKLFQHVVLFAAINGLLISIWILLTGGSIETLRSVMDSPSESVSLGFWPVWPILAWSTLLIIHLGLFSSNLLFGDRQQRRRRRMARDASKTTKELAMEASKAGREIAKEVVSAIDKAHARRLERDERRGRRSMERSTAAEQHTPPGRRWVTVMFCDIAESTAHNERLGDDEWARILAHVRGLVRNALVARGGSEVGTQGDGMLARFEGPPDAVMCAVDVQGELVEARKSSDFIPDLRIGIHAGEVVEEDGDLVGRVINLASRVTSQAEPGEILVTEPVADQLVGKLELEDRGLRELKGLAQPRHLLAVKWGG